MGRARKINHKEKPFPVGTEVLVPNPKRRIKELKDKITTYKESLEKFAYEPTKLKSELAELKALNPNNSYEVVDAGWDSVIIDVEGTRVTISTKGVKKCVDPKKNQ